MNKKVSKYKWLIILPILLWCCNNSSPKIKKFEYYKSGKLKSVSFFIKDSIPIDTVKNYYEKGNLKSIEVRDDSGILNGVSSVFYEMGQLKITLPYINGKEQGFATFFSIQGKIEAEAFYFNDTQVGDVYYFDSLGRISSYRFKDFRGKSRIQIDYSDDRHIYQKNCQFLFLDSFILSPNKEQKIKNWKSCEVLLIISNPPKCRNAITLSFWDKGQIYKIIKVPIGQYYKTKETILANTDSIITICKQYDSISQKETYEKSITPVLEEK